MDNTVEALYIAAAVLIFMLALSLTLSSFSTFRSDLEDLIQADERVDAATITDTSTGKTTYINYISGEEERRTVGIESVVNSLYRVYKENYIVVMKLESYDSSKLDRNGSILQGTSTALQNQGLISQAAKKQIYAKDGSKIIDKDERIIVFDLAKQNDKNFINTVLENGLYNILKDKTFTEYTGIYYEDDSGADGVQDTEKPKNVSDANKKTARIITYIEN